MTIFSSGMPHLLVPFQEAKESKESRERGVWGLQSGYEQAALKLILKSALAGLLAKTSDGGSNSDLVELGACRLQIRFMNMAS